MFSVPPIPSRASFAVLLIVIGMVAAAAIAGRDHPVVAMASAGMIGALLIVSAVIVLSAYAPPALIPDLAPHALSPADDLAQSRDEIQDPYVVLLVFGGVMALMTVVAALRPSGWHRIEPQRAR